MGIAYTPARPASIRYGAALGTTPCSARATSAQQDEWDVSLAGHHFLLNASRHKAEELLEVFGELYDKAYPVTAKPRELPSLDCDAARDGTVWADSDKDFPFHYRFRGSHWEYFALEGESRWAALDDPHSLSHYGPYTEVVE
ncbi:hypothetical protein PROPHIGD86-1_66 [Mycobacterium phage prophi86-1]|nr:hypothetical protein PROPHIGD86-1_66 [Mycobacterium phage prophi86-1]